MLLESWWYIWNICCLVLLSVCKLINRMPSSVLQGKVLFSCLYPGRSIFHIVPRVFRFTCFVQNLSSGLDKLSPKSVKCLFVGFRGLRKDIGVTIILPRSIMCLLVLHSLRLFHTFLQIVQVVYQYPSLSHRLFHCHHQPTLDATAPRSQTECTKQPAQNHFRCLLVGKRFLPLHLP